MNHEDQETRALLTAISHEERRALLSTMMPANQAAALAATTPIKQAAAAVAMTFAIFGRSNVTLSLVVSQTIELLALEFGKVSLSLEN